MMGDPYEEANQQLADEAKLMTPGPAPKSRKIVYAGLVLAGLVLGIVILGNIAALVTKNKAATGAAVRPTTMTKGQSDSFAKQQSGQADYIKGTDRNNRLKSNEDTVLGKGSDLAADAYDEADGVPKKTKAQDDAEHGRTTKSTKGDGQDGGTKSEAEQRRERAALEAAHRRQNDLDSSAVSVDFSDYFDKQKDPAPATSAVIAKLDSTETAGAEAPLLHRHSVLREEDANGNEETSVTDTALVKKHGHDPVQDFEFDASFGKLYRLMQDTIIETVLVNRLAGASVGPVITMVTTDVYSQSRAHLLIPKGTRLLGHISAVGSLNQERLFVAFHRMIMPDGYSVSLDKFQGLDVVGQTGLADLVNHHYVRIFGASLALAAVAATTQIGNAGSSYGAYDWGTSMRNGATEGLGQSAQRVMERFLNTLPTFTIRERTRVKTMLSGDLLLPDTKNHAMDSDL